MGSMVPGAGGSAMAIGMGPGQGGGGLDRWRQEAGVRSSPNTKHTQCWIPALSDPRAHRGPGRALLHPRQDRKEGGREDPV